MIDKAVTHLHLGILHTPRKFDLLGDAMLTFWLSTTLTCGQDCWQDDHMMLGVQESHRAQ
jgi:hypothetical protein